MIFLWIGTVFSFSIYFLENVTAPHTKLLKEKLPDFEVQHLHKYFNGTQIYAKTSRPGEKIEKTKRDFTFISFF